MKKVILMAVLAVFVSTILAFASGADAAKAKTDKNADMMMDESATIAERSGSMKNTGVMMENSGTMADESGSMQETGMMMEKTQPMTEKEMPKSKKAKEASSY